jgi:hypothetical protein
VSFPLIFGLGVSILGLGRLPFRNLDQSAAHLESFNNFVKLGVKSGNLKFFLSVGERGEVGFSVPEQNSW